MIGLALLSPRGGVGRTTIIAHLATAIARLERPVLAIDFDPQNVLGIHLGMHPANCDGLCPRWLSGGDWHAAGLSVDGIRLLPFGVPAPDDLRRFEQALLAQPDWLARQIDTLDLPPETVVLFDTPVLPSIYARQAIQASVLCAGVLRPDALAPLAIARLDAWLGPSEIAPLILNAVDPTDTLGATVLDLVRSQYAERIAPEAVHLDRGLDESLAADASVYDYAPHSQAAHDLQGLSRWLLSRLDAVAELLT